MPEKINKPAMNNQPAMEIQALLVCRPTMPTRMLSVKYRAASPSRVKMQVPLPYSWASIRSMASCRVFTRTTPSTGSPAITSAMFTVRKLFSASFTASAVARELTGTVCVTICE